MRGAWALLLAFCAGCTLPGTLRDPRVLGPGLHESRYHMAATRVAARVDSGGGPAFGQFTVPELGLREDVGLRPRLGLEGGLRWDGLLDGGMEASLKWQWLGWGEARALAGTLALDLETAAIIIPNDIGLAALFAIPLGRGDLCPGIKVGQRLDGEQVESIDPTARIGAGNFRLPQGQYGELQLSWWDRAPGAHLFGGIQVRQEFQPTRHEVRGPNSAYDWAFEPAVRVELGLAFGGRSAL